VKGDPEMMTGKNSRTKNQCHTLEDKMCGPFRVIETGRKERGSAIQLLD
jgi:hypothetical protein